jgi:hypothetical protein
MIDFDHANACVLSPPDLTRAGGCRVGLRIVLFDPVRRSLALRARTLAPSPICDQLHRRLQPFRHLDDCSGCFRRRTCGEKSADIVRMARAERRPGSCRPDAGAQSAKLRHAPSIFASMGVGPNALGFAQMLDGERGPLLRLEKQAENHLGSTEEVAVRIKLRILTNLLH